jgi:predicted DNA-binding protein
MAIYDNVADDPSPIVLSSDLADQQNGAKKSTLIRAFYELKKAEMKVDNMDDFFVAMVIEGMKQDIFKLASAKDASIKTDLDAYQLAKDRVRAITKDSADLIFEKSR